MNDNEINKLISDNEKLVGYCFKEYIGNYNHPEYEDIIQEGYLELIRAAKNFDPDKGLKFSTYAVPCIGFAMRRYANFRTSIIKVPRRIYDSKDIDKINLIRNYCSLDKAIDENDNTIYSIMEGKEDDYEFIIEDLIESFLATIENPKHKSIMEEYYYSCVYGEKIKQREVSQKYNISQSYFVRLKNLYNEKFIKFLNERRDE